MPILLRLPTDLPATGFQRWCTVDAEAAAGLPSSLRMVDLPRQLETAFDACARSWADLARGLGGQPSAGLAHMPACAANISDFGLMLAWDHLARAWAGQPETTLVVCSDPWLFRHLSQMQGVSAGRPPPLIVPELRLTLRGLAARIKVALTAARASLAGPPPQAAGQPWLLVYGHPASDAAGNDAYFGSLMQVVPSLRRALHVDCPIQAARRLEADGRTVSLHRFGSPLAALGLWHQRWRAAAPGPYRWLVRRAVALEGGTGSAAMIAWQSHCQRRWLRQVKPAAVAWPWENHSWERTFVRLCRSAAVRTIGYQHATVGWREWNYGPQSNPDGEASLPDRIFASGAVAITRLRRYGHGPDRISEAGALRFPESMPMPRHDPAAPVYVALPFDGRVAAEMVDSLRPLGASGMQFRVKDHPMSPYRFQPSPGIERTDDALSGQAAVGAVLYALTTVGLEALLAGLPVVRFVPACRPVADIMPEGVVIATATAGELATALANPTPPPALSRGDVFARPDIILWREALS